MTADLKPDKRIPLDFENFVPLFKESLKGGKTVFTFDLDQVLVNTAKAVLDEYNQQFADNIKWAEDVKTWFPLKIFLLGKGFKEEEAVKIETNFWKDPKVLLRAEPLFGSFQFFNEITTFSFGRTHIITTRAPELREATFEWLDKWWISKHPYFMREQVWIRDDDKQTGEDFKLRVIGGVSNAVGSNGKVLHIDDSPEICDRVLNETKAVPILLQSTVEVQNPDSFQYPVIPRRKSGGQMLLDIYSLFLERKLDIPV